MLLRVRIMLLRVRIVALKALIVLQKRNELLRRVLSVDVLVSDRVRSGHGRTRQPHRTALPSRSTVARPHSDTSFCLPSVRATAALVTRIGMVLGPPPCQAVRAPLRSCALLWSRVSPRADVAGVEPSPRADVVGRA